MPKENEKVEPEFVDRVNNPEKYPFIRNEDGRINTHKMAAETNEQGEWFVFPMIVMLPTGKLHEFKNIQSAMSYNIRTGNYLEMPEKEAKAYAKGGYKTKKLRNFWKTVKND